MPEPSVQHSSSHVVLFIDLLNHFEYPNGRELLKQAEPVAANLVKLKSRARRANVPVVYVNDNFGQWRSDFRATVAHCCSTASPGHRVSRKLRPKPSDYFVLKPKHSGFYDTTLETLLESLAIRRVIITGMAGNICVLFTANDAYMRGLRVIAPRDCIVSNTPEDNAHALRQIEVVLKGRLTPSDRLRFHGPASRRTSPRVGV